MAKVYAFEGFNNVKIYGDFNGALKIVIVKGAADKADARKVAEENLGGLRIVNGGRAFANEDKATEYAKWSADLTNRTNATCNPGDPDTTWFIVDAGMQRDLADLVGMRV